MFSLDRLDPRERAVVEGYLRPVRFKRGDCIMRQGDPGDGCYLIDEGEVQLELLDAETTSESVLCYLHPGEFLGEFSLLDGEPRSCFAYAHTAVAARWFSRADFETLGDHYPQIGLALSNALGRNLTSKLRRDLGRMSEYLFADEADASTNAMVARATVAQREFAGWSEERIDALLHDLAQAVAGHAGELAAACVEETGIGVVRDKVTKIVCASLNVYQTLTGRPASGTLQFDAQRQVMEIAAPMGVILGLIPVTNPVSTIIFKTLICLKTRNALIYSCHHNALGVANQTGDIIQTVLRRRDAPVDLVQWIRERASRRKTMMLMKHKDIAFILATGGPSLVKAAYSSGTPAIGVGAGNAPVWVCADADPSAVAQMVITSKSFDNGVICASENNLVVEAAIREALIQSLQAHGAAVLTPEEQRRFMVRAFDEQGCLDRALVGKTAQWIAQRTNILRAYPICLLVLPATLAELNGPLGQEKLAPMVSLFTVQGDDEALQVCRLILNNAGRGHTAVIHTHSQERIERFGQAMEASRILANVPATLGTLGIGTGLQPSFTLGCGTFGGTSTTDGVTYTHLLNIKRVALGHQP